MASIHVRFGEVMGAGAPVYASKPRKSETVTSSASSAQTTNTANSGDYATISAIDGSVYVTTGSNPTALATGAGMDVVISGTVKDFGPLKDGDKVAVIDV